MPATLNGYCPSCRGEIHLPASSPGGAVECPHCGRRTAAAAMLDLWRAERRWRRVGWSVLGVVVIGLAVVAYRYQGHLFSAWGFLSDALGGNALAVLALAAVGLILVCLAFWVLFPLIIYFGLRDLRRRTALMEKSMGLCARHLARLSDPPIVSPAPPESAPVKKDLC